MDRVASYREIQILARGAEAELVLAEWAGLEVVVKRRTPREYLNPVLDARIRARRTMREAQMLHEAKLAGVPTPIVYFVDPVSSEIFMEYITGVRLKEILEGGDGRYKELARIAGEYLGLLHKAGIVHGDPTPANLILRRGILVMLDFGLSYRSVSPDDYAVDLHVLKQSLRSYHSEVFEEAYHEFLGGYSSKAPRTGETLAKLNRLEASGRYKQVV